MFNRHRKFQINYEHNIIPYGKCTLLHRWLIETYWRSFGDLLYSHKLGYINCDNTKRRLNSKMNKKGVEKHAIIKEMRVDVYQENNNIMIWKHFILN